MEGMFSWKYVLLVGLCVTQTLFFLLTIGEQKHYATSRKVAGTIPDELIGFFNWSNPSSRTMALRSTQPLK
jgi:hypothetical protein